MASKRLVFLGTFKVDILVPKKKNAVLGSCFLLPNHFFCVLRILDPQQYYLDEWELMSRQKKDR